MKKLIALAAFTFLAMIPKWAYAGWLVEPEAKYARIGVSTITVAISTSNWTLIPSSTTPPSPVRSAIVLDLLAGTTSQSVRLCITSSTLSPEQQYGVKWASATVPGEFEMRGTDQPLLLDINSSLYVWACTTSTVYAPGNLPRISAQELLPRP